MSRPGLCERLFGRVDISTIVFFRIAFGFVMLWHVYEYYSGNLIETEYINPQYHCTWYWLDWVQVLPGNGLYVVFLVMGLASLGVLLGWHYRLSAVLLCLTFTYQFLLDELYYLNHYYLTCEFALLLIFIPANTALSIDALLKPKLRDQTAPRWALWLLQFHVALPYFFGGVAKLAPDWLRGQPMALVLELRQDRLDLLAPYASEPWLIMTLTWGGLIFDLLVVPLLLWKRTRLVGFLVSIGFHLHNHVFFDIGYFPWFMMLATTVFFEPDWPRRLWRAVKRTLMVSTSPPPDRQHAADSPVQSWADLSRLQRCGTLMFSTWVFVQLVLPFRHYLYAGPSAWTEEGSQFAWHMMLRQKQCALAYYVTDRDTQTTYVADLYKLITPRQARHLGFAPDTVHEMALFMKAELDKAEMTNTEIRVINLVSLNGRKPQLLIDPRVDLAAEPLSWRRPEWLLELTEPLMPDYEWWRVPVHDWKDHVDISEQIRGTPMEPMYRDGLIRWPPNPPTSQSGEGTAPQVSR